MMYETGNLVQVTEEMGCHNLHILGIRKREDQAGREPIQENWCCTVEETTTNMVIIL